ncbi:MAG: NRDE family protein [Halobacteriales archaeon]
MCTIVFAYGVFDGFAVASNRDESYGREYALPGCRERTDGWVFAPRDERAGGTWIGFNANGVFVTLSNLPGEGGGKRGGTRSRGALVDELLRALSVEEARRVLRNSYDRHEYEGFNVVVASPDDCFVGVNDGSLRFVEPDPGIGVVTNSPFDEPDDKALRVSEAVPEPHPNIDPVDWLDDMRPLLADHELGVCVHGDGRGTTSSNLVYSAPEPDGSYWLFADGAPCETSYGRVFPTHRGKSFNLSR